MGLLDIFKCCKNEDLTPNIIFFGTSTTDADGTIKITTNMASDDLARARPDLTSRNSALVKMQSFDLQKDPPARTSSRSTSPLAPTTLEQTSSEEISKKRSATFDKYLTTTSRTGEFIRQ